MQFELTPEQVEKALKWQHEQRTKIVQRQLENPDLRPEQRQLLQTSLDKGKPQPLAGAIGGIFTYSFTMTTLGLVTKVKCAMTKEELNLTDYDDW